VNGYGVECDQDRFGQQIGTIFQANWPVSSMQNLVANAVDAMPDGWVLTVGSGHADDRWRLGAGDTGFGIPVGLRPRVFEPFVTLGQSHGTGLGLDVAKEIVKGHGGRLNFEILIVEESAGQMPDTTFTIDLPVSGLVVATA
jgi:signal transduction histidine kinase|tara:strand:- start:47064 stop:47489 length:426 start_codon:yes stop_codon:yes gene_type:complete